MPRSSRVTLGSGKFIRLVRDGRWEFAERTNARGAVAIIAVTRDRRLVLTEQFRPAIGQNVIDLPAGLSGDVAGAEDEPQAASALRELVEETGYTAKRLRHVASCPSSPGLSSEVIACFFTSDVTRIGTGGGVDHEAIQVHTPKITNIKTWLSRQAKAGKMIDTKVYLGLYFAMTLSK